MAIVDWENSGFSPPIFEDPLWLQSAEERAQSEQAPDYEVDRLINFLRDPEWLYWDSGHRVFGKTQSIEMLSLQAPVAP